MYRRRAEEAHQDLLTRLEQVGGISAMEVVGDRLYLASDDLQHPEDVSLIVQSREPGDKRIGGITFTHQGPVLFVFVDLEEDLIDQLNKRDYRKTIVHEFIHLFDSERMTAKPKTSHLSTKDYYNSPVETNAYIQEALSDLEEIFRRMTPQARAVQMQRLSRSFEDFLGVMRQLLEDDFFDHRSVKTDRKLTRRLYRYWDELVKPQND